MEKKPALVPNPCHEDWDKLTPEQRGHFCTVCETKVWDLSSLTKEEADAFLAGTSGDLCVSYREKRDGTVVHRESNVVPLARLARHLPAAAGFSLALAACTSSGQPTPENTPPQEEAVEEPAAAEAGAAQEDPVAEPEAEPEVEPKPEPDHEQHVKGKWARPEDNPNNKEKPEIKKGKVKRHDG